MNPPASLGIALGSGGARGLAHIGILEALAELDFHPEFVTGTSIGSIVGAAYADNRLPQLHDLAVSIDLRTFLFKIMDFGMPRSGLVEGKRIQQLLEELLPDTSFEKLRKPFRCVAAALKTGDEVVFSSGPLIPAIRASISIPGIFTPIEIDGRHLIDGGLVNPIPVDQVRELGAKTVIAVDVNHGTLKETRPAKPEDESPKIPEWITRIGESLHLKDSAHLEKMKDWFRPDPNPNLVEVLGGTLHIIENQVGRVRMKIDQPDLCLRPEVGDVEVLDFHRARDIIAAGRECVEANKDALLALCNPD